ncbi:MAG: hypothetical protein NVS9B12_11580 [Vulcanimicrobiaceae bacterium]
MQRGFTLAEVVVAVGILALMVLSAAAYSFGSRPLARQSAQAQIEAQITAARAIAQAGGDGATVIFQPRSPLGFKSVVYEGRPDHTPLRITSAMPVMSAADVREASGGGPPFALFISGSGHVSLQGAYPSPAQFDTPSISVLPREPACPSSGYRLIFSAGAARGELDIPCG